MGAILAVPMIVAALVSAALVRWTRLPLLTGPLVLGALTALLALFVLGSFGSPGALIAALLAGVIIACAGALGMFLGWLRRCHIERIG